MQLFCPACQAAFTGVARCPRCGGLLLMPQEAATQDAGADPDEPAALIRPTPTGRVVVGTVLALGLYLGLRKLVVGWAHATQGDPAGWWLTADGLTAVFGLQAAATLLGALLAGAGRRRGFPIGVAVGGVCGGLFLAAEVLAGTPVRQLVLLVHLATLALGGGVAAVVGARVWAAVPELDMPLPATKKLSSIQLDADPPGDAGRPTHWARVLVGAAIIVAGVGLADKARQGAQKMSGGLLRVESVGQGRFLTWQLATFAVLVGGVAAGSGTGAGVRHGVFAGLLGAAGLVGLTASRGEILPPVAYQLDRLNWGGAGPLDPQVVVAIAAGVLSAALIGGWLGGALLLPLAPPHMRTRLKLGQD